MASIELVETDKVLEAVKFRGPLIPLEVRSYLKKGDSIVIGAELSGLTQRGLVKVTNVKRGGSPFYYVAGQEPKLESISKYLNEKDLRTYNLLRQEKVLRDSKQEPLTRVGLRNIKDFSRHFTVKVNDTEEIFWRYYLVSEREAIDLVKQMFAPPVKEPVKEESALQQASSQSTERKPEPVRQVQKPIQERKETIPKPAPKPKSIPKPIKHEEQQELDTIDSETVDLFSNSDDEFLLKIKKFFDEKRISVKESKLIRKKSDYEFVIEMETPVGTAEYFCKAKSKKKCNDGDLSSAYVQGQMRRIPTVFLTTGEVTKKAKEKTKTDYKGMLIKEI